MNKIFNLVLLLTISLTLSAFAQEGEGAFRLANATGLDGRLKFFINGYEISSEGYESGQTTGNLDIPSGMLDIKVQHPLCEDSQMQLNLVGGQQIAIIAYVEPLKDKQTGEVKKRVIKFGKLESKPRSDKRSAALLFLSVSNQVEVMMNGSAVVLTPHKQVDVAFGDSRSTGVSIEVGKRLIGGLDLENPGDYAVIVFDKADGTQGCITFYNTKH